MKKIFFALPYVDSLMPKYEARSNRKATKDVHP